MKTWKVVANIGLYRREVIRKGTYSQVSKWASFYFSSGYIVTVEPA
jgi:hypothetical protein